MPVLTALDNRGGVFQAILVSLMEIEAALDGRIAANSVLCSVESAAYANVADRAGAEHRPLFVPAATVNSGQFNSDTKRGRLGLPRLNNHHQRLKYLIKERCRGVATKYLGHYLGWHRVMVRPGFQGKTLLDRALR